MLCVRMDQYLGPMKFIGLAWCKMSRLYIPRVQVKKYRLLHPLKEVKKWLYKKKKLLSKKFTMSNAQDMA